MSDVVVGGWICVEKLDMMLSHDKKLTQRQGLDMVVSVSGDKGAAELL